MSEWFDDLGAISIGCQAYGTDEPYGHLKVGLWQRLCKEMPSVSIGPVRHLALALRVGGKFKDFSKVQITHTRVMAKKGYVGCDIEIPSSKYVGLESADIRQRLRTFVIDGVENLLEALKKKRFEGNYDEVLASFKNTCRTWELNQ